MLERWIHHDVTLGYNQQVKILLINLVYLCQIYRYSGEGGRNARKA
jgi:hypothetical protein